MGVNDEVWRSYVRVDLSVGVWAGKVCAADHLDVELARRIVNTELDPASDVHFLGAHDAVRRHRALHAG